MTKALSRKENVITMRQTLIAQKAEIQAALPKGMDADNYLRVANSAIGSNPKLQLCSIRSVVTSVIEASQLGLELDGALGHAWLIPWKKKDGSYYADWLIGYRGLLDLIHRAGKVHVAPKIVYTWDDFDYQEGDDPKITHRPKEPPKGANPNDEKNIKAVYSIATFHDSNVKDRCLMWKREVDGVRARSKAKSSGPWVTDYAPMALKSVLRRHSKVLPMSKDEKIDVRTAIQHDEARDLGFEISDADIVDEDETTETGDPKDIGDKVADLKDRLKKAEDEPPPPTEPEGKGQVQSKLPPPVSKGAERRKEAVKGEAAPAGIVWDIDTNQFVYSPSGNPDLDADYTAKMTKTWKKPQLLKWEEKYRHLIKGTFNGVKFPDAVMAKFYSAWSQKCKADYFDDDQPGAIVDAEFAETEAEPETEAKATVGEDASGDIEAEFEMCQGFLTIQQIASIIEPFGVNDWDSLNPDDKKSALSEMSRMVDAINAEE
jgi:recombination protein RecT